MKTLLRTTKTLALVCALTSIAFASGGLETFDNFTLAQGSYFDGSFVGENGITWNYIHATGAAEANQIDGNGMILRRSGEGSRIVSQEIPGGIGNFSVQMRKAFTGTGDRQVELFINDVSKGQSITFGSASGADDTVHTFAVNDINIEGNVVIEIRNIQGGSNNRQLTIDNISWTSYGDPGVAIPSNTVAVTAPATSVERPVGDAVEIITESWSNFTAYVGYGPSANGSDWQWLPVTTTPAGIGYRGSAEVTPAVGISYIGARWIDDVNNRTYYGWNADGQINASTMAAVTTITVTSTPAMVLVTPWDLDAGDMTGISTGADITANVPQLPSGYIADFEDASGGSYVATLTTMNGIEWMIGPQALVGTADNDMKFGDRAARIRLNEDVFGSLYMTEDFAGGLSNVSLYAARANFTGDRTGVAPSFVIEYSIDQGFSWDIIGNTNDLDGVDTLTLFSYEYHVTQPVRIRVRQTAGDADKRWNVDNISLALPGEGPYTGILEADGFTHALTRDLDSSLTFEVSTAGYQVPGFYCDVRRSDTGPQSIDLDFFDGTTWLTETITFHLPNADQWYTIGRSYDVTGDADTAFRLVGYAATASDLEIDNIMITAPIPEPGIFAIALLGIMAFIRRSL